MEYKVKPSCTCNFFTHQVDQGVVEKLEWVVLDPVPALLFLSFVCLCKSNRCSPYFTTAAQALDI